MHTTLTTSLDELHRRIAELAPLVREHASAAEAQRRLAAPVATALRDAGLYHLFRPRALGGLEVDPATGFRAIAELARIDSAAAWNIAIGNATETFGAWYSDAVVTEVFGSPTTVFAGAWNPPRRAVPVDGGYRVAGTTIFSSNCHAATWLLGLAHVYDGNAPRLDADGAPETVLTLNPMREARIVDNWNVLGMRGTGSHDVVLDDVFVPSERATPLAPLERPAAAFAGPMHSLANWPATAAGVPVALGIARAALDDFIALATEKTPSYTANTLQKRPVVQMQIAQAEATLGAAEAYFYETFDAMWQDALDGRGLDLAGKARCQLACSHGVVAAAEAVDLVHAAAGAAAIRNEQHFQRHFRDVHVITQHAFTSASRFESAGQILLGLEPDWPFFKL